jgi:uncharacterized protein with GYD domain
MTMAPDEATGAFNPFFAKVLDGAPETYFSLWTITEEGRRDPAKVQAALVLASNRLRDLGGRCRLYVTLGGPADLVGVAKGPLDERQMLALQQAIQVSGILTTVLFKALEFTADDYAAYTTLIDKMSRP